MSTIQLDMVRELMKTMAKYKAIIGEEYASGAYSNALGVVTTPKILESIVIAPPKGLPRGVGVGIQSFIAEALLNGSVAELDTLRKDPRVKAVEKLETLIGVGPATAMKWVSEGTMTIADASTRTDLTTAQRIGISVDGRVMHRVPRKMVEKVFGVVSGLFPKGTETMITGSYRRGAQSSGDVDILVISDDLIAKDLPRIPSAIVLNAGEMKVSYLVPVKDDAVVMTPADGIIPSATYIQVDVFVSPSASRVAYLAYSTGSAAHNVYLRSLAKSKGYHLSQYSLTDASGKIVPLKTEEDLYASLGITYVPPEKR